MIIGKVLLMFSFSMGFSKIVLFFSRSKLIKYEDGITSIEYGLIAVAIAIFIVSVLYGNDTFTNALEMKFQLLSSTVKNALFYVN